MKLRTRCNPFFAKGNIQAVKEGYEDGKCDAFDAWGNKRKCLYRVMTDRCVNVKSSSGAGGICN